MTNPDVYDPRVRTLDEMRHQTKVGPLDRADWPSADDEVLYHHPYLSPDATPQRATFSINRRTPR